MANDIGSTLLNSLTNSTFDSGNMAKVMAEASVAGPRAILDKKEEKTNTELGALTYLESNIQAFNSYLVDLSSPKVFDSRLVSSSDESVVSVQATGQAVSGAYQIESKQLAQAHTIVSNKAFSSTSDTISTGTLSISVGGQTKDIVIDSSNNTLEGLQSIINNGDYGVNAAIVNNNGQYQIMFSSKNTGAASNIGLSGLADFDVDGVTTTSEARDAVMSINGLNIANSTNSFNNVIDGLDIQLKTVSAVTQSVSVASDTQKVVDTVSNFVEVYNQLDTILDDLGSYRTLTAAEQDSPDFDYFGDLSGSSLLRDLKEQLRNSLTGAISQLSDPNTLAAAGISFDKEGQMSLDTAVLNNLASNSVDSLGLIFSQGGSSTDPLINVIGGSDETLAGNYSIEVSSVAERATVAGSAVTYAPNEFRASGDRVFDSLAALTIDSGASLQVSISGGANVSVNLTAGDYTTKEDVATQIQTDINAALAGSTVAVAYDSSQSRYEVTTADGTLDLSSFVGMDNQGFNSGLTYTGEQLIDLSAAAATFDVSINASTTATASIAAGKYTLDELSNTLQNTVNGLSEVSSSGGVSVSSSGGVLNMTSDRYGFTSDVTLSNFSNFANAGLTANLTDGGENVDGTITTAAGTLSLGAYADTTDGRKIKISDFAVIAGGPADVRGLEFEILGGATGPRGGINFSQGFASRLEDTIQRLFEDENGLVKERIDSLSEKSTDYEDKREKLDLRYDKLLLKYKMEFGMLQSLLSSTQQTSAFLTATFSNNNQNN
ncbi:Flagellar hook-associated protein FliD [hydrothermal vent metagenome]|uniref:Filament cap protein n=1 Tax=hydrothermal vent metagenome TaxID=652676 RepID=A0A3B0W4E3_9ZZZZ